MIVSCERAPKWLFHHAFSTASTLDSENIFAISNALGGAETGSNGFGNGANGTSLALAASSVHGVVVGALKACGG